MDEGMRASTVETAQSVKGGQDAGERRSRTLLISLISLLLGPSGNGPEPRLFKPGDHPVAAVDNDRLNEAVNQFGVPIAEGSKDIESPVRTRGAAVGGILEQPGRDGSSQLTKLTEKPG
jgi:hypothetical protein